MIFLYSTYHKFETNFVKNCQFYYKMKKIEIEIIEKISVLTTNIYNYILIIEQC